MNEVYYKKQSTKTKFFNFFRKLFRNGFFEKMLISVNKNAVLAKLIPPHYLYKQGSWRKYDRNGIRLRLDFSRAVDHYTYFNYPDKGFDNFLALVKENAVVLDIGANIGTTALKFAQKASKGKVVCYEPSKATFARLTENVAMNDRRNIFPQNKGVGDTIAEFPLHNVDPSNPGMNRIIKDAGQVPEGVQAEMIHITTLEHSLQETGVVKVDAIKIDVEGFEYDVLKGSAGILKKDKPFLFIELVDDNLKNNNSTANQLVNFLKGLEYKIVQPATMEPFAGNYDFSNCAFDILCFPN
jgi:FkbM family methyltransferase